jgi:hypothetical protein
MSTRLWIAAWVVGALVVFGGTALWMASRDEPNTPAPVGPQGAQELRADLEGLGMVISDTSPEGKIGRDEAVAVALREQQFAGGDLDAYLVRLTDPTTAITDRDVWIVRFSGLNIEVPVPDTPSRIPVDGGTITTAYVYVDAVTGEWLLTWAEG